MSIVLVGSTSGSITLQEPAVAGSTVLDLPAVSGTILTTTSPKAGNVIQVVQAVKTDTFSTTGTSFVDITGFNVSITPTSASSKILVMVCLHIGIGSDAFPAFYLIRNSTTIGLSDYVASGLQTTFAHVASNADSRDQYMISPVNFTYLDSPATTSSINYKVQISPMRTTSRTVYVNRSALLGDTNQLTATSTITVLEIAA